MGFPGSGLFAKLGNFRTIRMMLNHSASISPLRLWISRLLIAYVLFVNLQSAVLFLLQPQVYALAFELSGVAGESMLRGMGLLFLMWNVPYAVALSHPVRRRISLYEAIVMQAIGLFGETFILFGLPSGHLALVDSVGRFILFDGIGLAALVVALFLTLNLTFTAVQPPRKE
jgi:hypothetical protein